MPTSSRKTLGLFLRTHRERLAPSEAGLLTPLHRRRTPGLRREETAQLCGISTTWYTWLEQGRDVSCSSATLSRIATALKLSTTERRYLFTLAELRDPQQDHTAPTAPATLLSLPEQISSPAYLLDPLWNVLSANSAAKILFDAWLNSSETNQLRYVFLNPNARIFLTDWLTRAQRLLAEFRADTVSSARTKPFQTLVSTLQRESPEFNRFWEDQSVLPREGGQRSFQHPTQGLLHYDQTTFIPTAHAGYKLVILSRSTATPDSTP
ncbi:MAG: helix-turn-helix transcriptional regulator [Gluconobacter cerinus]|uniref:helix-turn-helix transcriptional regulator n=1 Tax=Gluconobacter cerinus TaxID=38307 RepID=UPI0039E7BF18